MAENAPKAQLTVSDTFRNWSKLSWSLKNSPEKKTEIEVHIFKNVPWGLGLKCLCKCRIGLQWFQALRCRLVLFFCCWCKHVILFIAPCKTSQVNQIKWPGVPNVIPWKSSRGPKLGCPATCLNFCCNIILYGIGQSNICKFYKPMCRGLASDKYGYFAPTGLPQSYFTVSLVLQHFAFFESESFSVWSAILCLDKNKILSRKLVQIW